MSGIDFSDLGPIQLKLQFNTEKKSIDDANKSLDKVNANLEKQKTEMEKLNTKIISWGRSLKDALTFGVFSGGITGFISAAKNAMFELNEFRLGLKDFTDSTGSAAKAWDVQTSIWAASKGSLGTVKAAMGALNAQGFSPLHAGAKELTADITDLNIASGIGMDSMSQMTGGLIYSWNISKAGAKSLLNSMFVLQDSFGLTNKQIETMMGTVTEVNKKLIGFYSNSEEGAKHMISGVNGMVGAMRKFGVTVEEGGDWMKKVMDPEQLQENMTLFNRLGMSYGDITSMMESDAGKENFFDKMANNLPKVAKEIMSIKDPMARLQFSKKLGLPLEMANKLAKATGSELAALQEEYKKNTEQDAIKKKKEKAAAEIQEKWNEQLNFMKLKLLGPLTRLMPQLIDIFLKLFAAFEPVAKTIFNIFANLANIILPVVSKVLTSITQVIKKVISYIPGSGMSPEEKTAARGPMSTGAKIAGGASLAIGAYKAFTTVKDFIKSMKGELGTKGNPMNVVIQDMQQGLLAKWNNAKGFANKVFDGFKAGKQGWGMGTMFEGTKGLKGGILGAGKMAGLSPTLLKAGAFLMSGPGMATLGIGAAAAASIYGGVKAMKRTTEIFGEKAGARQKAATFTAGALLFGLGPALSKIFKVDLVKNMSIGIDKFYGIIQGLWTKIGNWFAGFFNPKGNGPLARVGRYLGGLFNILTTPWRMMIGFFKTTFASGFFTAMDDLILRFKLLWLDVKKIFKLGTQSDEEAMQEKIFTQALETTNLSTLQKLKNQSIAAGIDSSRIEKKIESLTAAAQYDKEEKEKEIAEKKRQEAEDRAAAAKDSKNLAGIAGSNQELLDEAKKKEDVKKIQEKSSFLDLWYTNNQVLKISVGRG